MNRPLQDSLISNPVLLTYLPSMCDPLLTAGMLFTEEKKKTPGFKSTDGIEDQMCEQAPSS